MNLKKNLSTYLPAAELNNLVQSFDVIGDIAIVIIPPELAHRDAVIGTAVLNSNKNIKVVAKRAGHYQGSYRTIPLEIIAGEKRLETIHKEFGIRLKLNPADVYFSGRSSTERKRIADLVEPGETVLVMFSGIGPYPLHIARFSAASTIVGVEKNHVAHGYAQGNMVLNKLQHRIRLYEGDVAKIVPQLEMEFDRIIIPLPKRSSEYLKLALNHLRPGGVLHYYVMNHVDKLDQSLLELKNKCVTGNRVLSSYKSTVCGHTAPNTYRFCIDGLVD